MLEETGILKIKVDLRLWNELDSLSKEVDVDVAEQLVNRIHLKDKELDKWWKDSTVKQRVYPFRTKKIPVNKSPKNGKNIQALHKTVLATIPKAKLILEYNLLIRDLIVQLKNIDDGGEHE